MEGAGERKGEREGLMDKEGGKVKGEGWRRKPGEVRDNVKRGEKWSETGSNPAGGE